MATFHNHRWPHKKFLYALPHPVYAIVLLNTYLSFPLLVNNFYKWKKKKSFLLNIIGFLNLPGNRCPIVSATLPFLTFSTMAPYRPLGKSFPPTILRPRMVAPDVGPPPRLSLWLLWRTMCPTRRVPSAFGTHDTGC